MPDGRAVKRWVSEHRRGVLVAIVIVVVAVGVVVGVVVWLTTRRRPDEPPGGVPVRAQYVRLRFAEAGVQGETRMKVSWYAEGTKVERPIDGVSGDLGAVQAIDAVVITQRQRVPTDRRVSVILELIGADDQTVVYREALPWIDETTVVYQNGFFGWWVVQPRVAPP